MPRNKNNMGTQRLQSWIDAYILVRRGLIKKFSKHPYVVCWQDISFLTINEVPIGTYGKFVYNSSHDYGVDVLMDSVIQRRNRDVRSFISCTQEEYETAQALQFIQDCTGQ